MCILSSPIKYCRLVVKVFQKLPICKNVSQGHDIKDWTEKKSEKRSYFQPIRSEHFFGLLTYKICVRWRLLLHKFSFWQIFLEIKSFSVFNNTILVLHLKAANRISNFLHHSIIGPHKKVCLKTTFSTEQEWTKESL